MNDKLKRIILKILNEKKPVRGIKYNFDIEDTPDKKLYFTCVAQFTKDKNWTSWMLTGTANELITKTLKFVLGREIEQGVNFELINFVASIDGVGDIKIEENQMMLTENTEKQIIEELKKYLKKFSVNTDEYDLMFEAELKELEYREDYEQVKFYVEVDIIEIILRKENKVLSFNPHKFQDSEKAGDFINMTCGWLYDSLDGADGAELNAIFDNQKLVYDLMLDDSSQYISIDFNAFEILGYDVSNCELPNMDEYDGLISDYFALFD